MALGCHIAARVARAVLSFLVIALGLLADSLHDICADDRPSCRPPRAHPGDRHQRTRQLAEIGPAQLSVRAVARDLGMASSAVYRYFPSRDELLTELLVVIYGELADSWKPPMPLSTT